MGQSNPRYSSGFGADADYEILGAYQILGDPLASPIQRRAAQTVLSSARRPVVDDSQPCSGRINDRPRAAVPGPSRPMHIPSGGTVEVQFCPQVPVRGPFWLGMTSADALTVVGVMFGNQHAFLSPGEVPGAFFDARHPENMMAIAGQTLGPGMRATVIVRNVSAFTVAPEFCLWGNSEESLAQREAKRVEPISPVTAPRAGTTEGSRNGAGDCLSPASTPAAPAPKSEREQRCDADRVETLKLAALSKPEPFEPGDVWESPSDES